MLCEGDPAFYGSYQHLHTRLSGRFAASIVPGISSVSAAAAAVGVPLVQHDETLTVLPGTLPDDELRARLAGADAVAVLKLGRTFDKVRAALDDTGLLDRARYVERAGTERPSASSRWPTWTRPASRTCRWPWSPAAAGAHGPRTGPRPGPPRPLSRAGGSPSSASGRVTRPG